MVRYLWLSGFLLLVSLSSGETSLPYHSDFELGETYTRARVRPGQTRIQLDRNRRTWEWPSRAGHGILQPNFPTDADSFQYETRKGDILLGVTGIDREHAAGTRIQTGGFGEWQNPHWGPEFGKRGDMALDSQSRLYGRHSVLFDIGQRDELLDLTCPVPLGLEAYHARFYAMFTESLMASPTLSVPICQLAVGNPGGCRIHLVRSGSRSKGFLELHAQKGSRVLRSFAVEDSSRNIEPHTQYGIGLQIHCGDREATIVRLFLCGRLIAEQALAPAENHAHVTPRFRLGQVGSALGKGSFWCDETEISDQPIRSMPRKPQIVFENDSLVSSPFTDPFVGVRHTATQWQVHPENIWLAPHFDTGPERERKARMPLSGFHCFSGRLNSHVVLANPVCFPKGVKSGKQLWGRARHLGSHGRWSEWSSPCSLVFQKHSGEGNVGPHPVIEAAHFAEVGSGKSCTVVRPGRWYDFHIRLFLPGAWDNRAFADLSFCADPEECECSYSNRGGAFDAVSNRVVSFSLVGKNLFMKTAAHPRSFAPIQAGAEDFVRYPFRVDSLDAQRVALCAQVRLPADAQEGTWALRGYAVKRGQLVSPFVRKVFIVSAEDANPGYGRSWGPFLGILVVGAILLRLLTGSRLFRKRERPSHQVLTAVEGSDSRRIAQIKEFVSRHYSEPISTKEVAESLNLSLSWVSRTFSQETGRPLSQYINEIRISHAKEILSGSNRSITEVAFSVGFNSAGYFIKVFRDLENCSPKEYRDQHVR